MSIEKDMLDFYIEAEKAVLSGQSITRNGRTWTRADLRSIQDGRREWEQKVNARRRAGRPMYKLADFR